VNTATVNNNEATTWPVRYRCNVFIRFGGRAKTKGKPSNPKCQNEDRPNPKAAFLADAVQK